MAQSDTDENMHKNSAYIRTVVAIHNVRDSAKEAVESLQEKSISQRIQDRWTRTRKAVSSRTRNFFRHSENVTCDYIPQKYGYVFRPKSRWELVLLGGTVCGIEFCYSAETAFVTPILLSLGLNIKFVTMIWCLSPFIGFFLTPLLGSLSDSCESKFGRRRPFILLLSAGILLGLIFVPNGHSIGLALGDTPNLQWISNNLEVLNDTLISNNHTKYFIEDSVREEGDSVLTDIIQRTTNGSVYPLATALSPSELADKNVSMLNIDKRFVGKGNTKSGMQLRNNSSTQSHLQPWSIAFTVVGTVLLDFCADACQSPSRTYLLDVSLPEDHAAGLSTFTMMAGLGGSLGYLMGAVHWEETYWGKILGGQVNAVFTTVTIIFIVCLIATICTFPEIPLSVLKDPKMFKEFQQKLHVGEFQEKGKEFEVIESKPRNYGTTPQCEEEEGVKVESSVDEQQIPNGGTPGSEVTETTENEKNHVEPNLKVPSTPTVTEPPPVPLTTEQQPTLKEYLRSIVHMPKSLRILCLTNLFCWMSLVCYSLYFTDFVGEVVFGGDPQAPEDSEPYRLYRDGVRFGCWGMALYSLSCSIYSYFIEALVGKLGAKPVYIGGQLVYSVGMILMAVTRHPISVILLSPTAGVMYSTLFTMPYLLIAHYHCMQKFRDDKNDGQVGIRGIGTDIATVSSMVFLSQFILSLSMGSIVEAVGSNVATVCAAAVLSACGAISATQVMYLDM